MNLILVSLKNIRENEEGEFFFQTDERQTSHLRNILKVQLRQVVKVGVIKRGKGEGVITEESKKYYTIKLLGAIHLQKSEDTYIPIDVVICIPRPKVLNKFLQQLSSVGVKKIIIVFSDFANKSYESSKVLKNEEIKNALQLGLEQAMCTEFPEVFIHYSFSSFAMNIDRYSDDKTIKLCAHTEVKRNDSCVERDILCREQGKILLMVGCERGFSELEIYLIKKLQFRFFNLTERILKCETALLVIIGQLLLLTENVSLRPSGRKMCRHNDCASSEDGTGILPTENHAFAEIKKLLSTKSSFPHQLVEAVNDFINSSAGVSDTLESKPYDEQKDGHISGGESDVDALLRSIHALSTNKDQEEHFENVYLSLLLKKIKYKNKFILSYEDQQNNVDDDGVCIYRTRPYVSKKKERTS
ncbi:RNA methyltransferase, putative [Plasmodium knowlesi strain H]|uniref:16S rRNA (uracil(1498)-N(3))-methyltransferase n=3 Tax=Plasmodium knowlesi TaxID=5850 RepID=A0A5K1UQR7_PLAKH|nr:RNA methyltransferase, putative [Plasmodium knowlesi strain H]OTN64711.1 putative RNA methyltransferase [Plasmodium knowlesi]CAA9989105.1 RNA methyltransferase, putative [Plasmodium knowlesi strain H]SBO27320.1 RNA methyltransferase, putative [Plasmodium knowlesi strain H]SBO28944.1 RNA methyltransferase, putative [Plasmodium knowlesi strain H]VVS78579.1 RNA methyltransferase, putative [Plasmodium knowlesi strain H]|eukprot:XP_002261452.1 hypothetical protein, conserved [Plasmodium knowlesi strain H]